MKRRKIRQLNFGDAIPSLHRALVPKHVLIIETEGRENEEIVADMLNVPMDQSMVLDFTLGHIPGSPINPELTEEQIELIRLQALLNSRFRGRRFDFMGNGLVARMIRESLRTESWNPLIQLKEEE